MEDKAWWALSIVLTLFGYAFIYYLGRLHKTAFQPAELHQENEPLLDHTDVLKKLLRFSSTTWILFQEGKCAAKAANATFLIKGSASIEKMDDLTTLTRHDFHEPLRFFLKNLEEDGRPFYFQAKTPRDKIVDIKALPYKADNEKNQQPQDRSYIIFLRYLADEEGNDLVKRTQSNFDLVKQLIDDIALPCWLKRQDGQMLHVNNAYEKICAHPLRHILDQNIDIVEKSSQASNDMAYARAHKQCYRAKSTVIVGGIKRLLDVQESPLHLEFPFQEDLFIGLSVDHTHESDLTKQLQKHHHAFHSLLENLSIGIAIYGADTRLIFYNQIYARFTDYGEGDAWLQKKPTISEVLDALYKHQRLPPQPNFADFKKKRLSMFQNLTTTHEEILYFPDGAIARVTISPYPGGGIFYTFEDITDKLQLADRYNTLIDVLNTTLDNLYEGVAVVGEDGKLTLCNPSFIQLWGLTNKKCVKGTPYVDLLESCKANFASTKMWEKYKAQLLDAFTNRQNFYVTIEGFHNDKVTFTYTPLPNGSHLCSYLKVTSEPKPAKQTDAA